MVVEAINDNLGSKEKSAATRAVVGYFSASLVKSIYCKYHGRDKMQDYSDEMISSLATQ